MTVPPDYVYLVGTLPLLAIWVSLFVLRRDLREPMLTVSIFIGFVSVLTSYFWWTKDWWHPATLTATKVGIEDFLAGFGSGGIMAALYEELFSKRAYKTKLCYPGGGVVVAALILVMLLLLALTELTTFVASAVTMVFVAALMYHYRPDLLRVGLVSGLLMLAASLPSYLAMMAIDSGWIGRTYKFEHLSGALIFGIPAEELVFWFLAGLVWGPFYEYWKGERLRSTAR